MAAANNEEQDGGKDQGERDIEPDPEGGLAHRGDVGSLDDQKQVNEEDDE